MSQSLPSGHPPTREEIARIEVGHTTVSPGTARWLVLIFLVLVTIPLVVDAGARVSGRADVSTAWPELRGLRGEVQRRLAGPSDAVVARIIAANRAVLAHLHAFEDALEDEAVPALALRPPTQHLLSAWLGVGNERVYLGRDGWLFYRPDVEYVTGPGFLDTARLARRVASAREWVDRPHPDPREAILDFHRQLEARGVALLVVPSPVKASVHPERLVRGVTGRLDNPSYAAFVADLERHGVRVFDAWEALGPVHSADGPPLYLATYTHWEPRTMERVAAALARAVRAAADLPAVAEPGYTWERQRVVQTGDTAVMLDLPEGQVLYPPEEVDVRRVVLPDGSPWRPDRGADVLVLGDSFSNIYSLASMGWGDAAGLIEHLSLALARPVDRIVQNDEGAFATRARLRQEMAAGTDRLAGKRVVVYQFAARELAFGDWQLIELPPGPRP
jgi:hypothetical protein